jgi:hypothetical protein
MSPGPGKVDGIRESAAIEPEAAMPDARQLLADPVTRHMRTDPNRIRAGLSVAQVLDYIRDHEVGGRVVCFYVVDDTAWSASSPPGGCCGRGPAPPSPT